MQPFTTLTGISAPLPMINVDTDMIIPKQFLKTIERTGLGKNLFDELRHNEDGSDKLDFILNRAPWTSAQILVTGANFGCGSSREHAPWALLDFGLRCIIAPSFADIFFGNCFKNGILPITLPQDQVDQLMRVAEAGQPLTIMLEQQEVTTPDGQAYSFTIDSFRKHCLLNGLDEIGLTLEHQTDISQFEQQRPHWLNISQN